MIAAVLNHVERIQEWIGSWPTWTPTWSEPRAPKARPADRNPDALAAYLFGMLSPLPLFGALFGAAAVALGVKGLRHARDYPDAGGSLQSRIGISLGAFFATVYLAVGVFLVGVLWV